MGPYLSQPDVKKVTEMGADARFQYSATSMQGWRNQQEDSHIADLKLPNGEAIFGVFDGHGGKEVAVWVEKKFVETFKKLPEYKNGDYENALRKCFIMMDEMMQKDSSVASSCMSTGCTACVCLITKDSVICANSGDSRSVLARGPSALEMSEDHKPENTGEQRRIEAAGGFVEDGRVRGILSLSRALGDLEYKQNRKVNVEAQMITCVPEIKKVELMGEDKFLVIACDGIWDCLSSQECISLMHRKIKERKSVEKSAQVVEDMFDQIICKDVHDPNCDGTGTDNMTCILIEFKK
jgi:serine/threonine protein phosphatase PrpC